MRRTDELKKRGAAIRGGGGGDDSERPFVKWPDEEYAYIEGTIIDTWTGQYGLNVVIEIGKASPNLGLGTVEATVGLNHAALKDTITAQDVGNWVHISFDGWAKSKTSHNRYRLFTVLAMPDDGKGSAERPDEQPDEQQEAPNFDIDDDLPF